MKETESKKKNKKKHAQTCQYNQIRELTFQFMKVITLVILVIIVFGYFFQSQQ